MFPSEIAATETGYNGFAVLRVQTSSEGFIYFTPPPPHWQITECRLENYNRATRTSAAVVVEIFSQKYSATNANITIHVNKALVRTTGTDIIFTTPFVPSGTNYLVEYLSNGKSAHVFTGGRIDI